MRLLLFALLALGAPQPVLAQERAGADPIPQACTVGPQDILVTNVTTIDFRAKEPSIAIHSLLISNGRIVSIDPDIVSSDPSERIVVDGEGLTLIPGLHDMHAHVWDSSELAAQLAHGVTTVRNLSGMPFHLRMEQAVEEGTACGSHLATSGPILNGVGADTQLYHQLVVNAEEARAAVRAQHAAGYRRIKIYANLAPEAFRAAIEEADRLSMTIAGHTPEGRRQFDATGQVAFELSFEEVAAEKFETIEHVESIAWHALGGEDDLDRAREVARFLAQQGRVVTPTLVAHANLVNVAQSRGAFAARPGMDTVSPLALLVAQQSIERWAAEDPARERAKADFYRAFTKILDEEGVLLVAGSDAGIFVNLPGASLIEEIELLAEALQSPFKAIQAATATAAAVLERDDQSACIGVGCVADLVLLRCNPLEDVRCLRLPEAVIFQGRLFDADSLRGEHGLMAIARRHDQERTIAHVLEGLAAQGRPTTLDQLLAAIAGE